MRTLIVSLFILWFLPGSAFAAPVNAGFVHGLWYAEEPVFADTPNRIYVAFRNNTEADLTGTVHFLVDGVSVDSSEVHTLSGRVVEAWIDWTPQYGTHDITASIEDAVLHYVGGKTETVSLDGLTVTETRTIDRDTDGDGTGDKDDLDDDNDTVSDEDERGHGSDPRVPNPAPSETAAASITSTPSPQTERGLERFIDEGTADSIIGSITDRITDGKYVVDAYREERSKTMSDALIPEGEGSGITRSQIDSAEGNLWQKFVLGIGALLSHIWTFVLWLLSNMLTHPLLVQVSLLVGILYILFRTARRFGRRPTF